MALGVYLSRCDGVIDAVIDLDSATLDVRERAAVVRIFDDFFDDGCIGRMVADVGEFSLDSVVLAGNSYEHYKKTLSGHFVRDRLAEAGVNPNRVTAANLLEQVAMAHEGDPVGATAKARGLINVAALRAEQGSELVSIVTEPKRSVLVLGCTAEGLVAAQRLLQLGFSVTIADREDGCRRAGDAGELRATAAFVLSHPQTMSVDGACIADADGWVGDYRVTLSSGVDDLVCEVGGILIAEPERADWVIELRDHFQVDVDDEGRARSIQPSTHPAETVDPGIMVVAGQGAEQTTRDRVAVADAAALALVLQLSRPTITHFHDVSHVDELLCGGCASCVKTCAFGACSIDSETGLSSVDIRRCRGCGKCVVSCPQGARDVINSPHDYLLGAIRALADVDTDGQPKIIGFLCGGCGYPAADHAGRIAAERETGYPASFLPLRIPCGGRLDTLYVLEAFKQGFDGVTVFRCREGHCHNLIGNLDMDRRINLLRTVLRSRNLDDSRLRIVDISPFEGEHFMAEIDEVFETVGSLADGKGGRQ
jgi:F420-non-reducing hydrogenase iron-sulfur subunit